jgi:hypothetical protein
MAQDHPQALPRHHDLTFQPERAYKRSWSRAAVDKPLQWMHHYDNGDHIHDTSIEEGHLIRTCGFDYDEVERQLGNEPEQDSTVTMSDMSAAFSLVLEWILGADTLAMCGARAAALGCYLNPTHNNRFGSHLAAIADQAGCTRAALSKALITFRDSVGIHLSAGKLSGTRSTYREAQIKSLENGTHTSLVRKDLRSKRETS